MIWYGVLPPEPREGVLEQLHKKYLVLVGGAPINQKWAEEIRANGYAGNAVAAVKLATQLMQKKQ